MNPRIALGGLRLVAAVGLFAVIAIQIADRVVNRAFDAWEYFSYFTIETSLINIVVFAVGGVLALRATRDTVLFTVVRLCAVTYAVVTAAVYNLLLRSVPYEGFVGLTWPNEMIHVVIPALLVAEWLLAPGRPVIAWRALPAVLVYPLAWLGYSLVRGAATGIYPYPFLDPASAGWGSVLAYIAGLSAFIVALAALGTAWSRSGPGRRRQVRARVPEAVP